jgi:hypothetical protein
VDKWRHVCPFRSCQSTRTSYSCARKRRIGLISNDPRQKGPKMQTSYVLCRIQNSQSVPACVRAGKSRRQIDTIYNTVVEMENRYVATGRENVQYIFGLPVICNFFIPSTKIRGLPFSFSFHRCDDA